MSSPIFIKELAIQSTVICLEHDHDLASLQLTVHAWVQE